MVIVAGNGHGNTSCLTKAEEPSLPYYLPIAGGRIIRFIPFPRVLVLCEMQSASSRIWTRDAVYNANHYTTGTSLHRLTRSFRWCCLLGYVEWLYLLFPSLPRHFSRLDSSGMVIHSSVHSWLLLLIRHLSYVLVLIFQWIQSFY